MTKIFKDYEKLKTQCKCQRCEKYQHYTYIFEISNMLICFDCISESEAKQYE